MNVTTVRVKRECTNGYTYAALCLAGIGGRIIGKAHREPGTRIPEFQPKRFILRSEGAQPDSTWETMDGGWIDIDADVVGIPLIRRLHSGDEKPRIEFVVLVMNLEDATYGVSDLTYVVTPSGDKWSENFEEAAFRMVRQQLLR